jgi:hypothetical protein
MLVPAGLWLAIAHPVMFLVMLLLFAVAAVLLLGVVARGLVLVFRSLRR